VVVVLRIVVVVVLVVVVLAVVFGGCSIGCSVCSSGLGSIVVAVGLGSSQNYLELQQQHLEL